MIMLLRLPPLEHSILPITLPTQHPTNQTMNQGNFLVDLS